MLSRLEGHIEDEKVIIDGGEDDLPIGTGIRINVNLKSFAAGIVLMTYLLIVLFFSIIAALSF